MKIYENFVEKLKDHRFKFTDEEWEQLYNFFMMIDYYSVFEEEVEQSIAEDDEGYNQNYGELFEDVVDSFLFEDSKQDNFYKYLNQKEYNALVNGKVFK